jgi:hypothetical protein
MEFATMKDLIENLTSSIDNLIPKYNSGYNAGVRDYYSCPCCHKSEPVDHSSNNRITLDDMEHLADCPYILLKQLKDESEIEENSSSLDNIILDEDLYEERSWYE